MWVHFAVSVNRCKCDVKSVTCLHAFDMCLKLRKKASCAVDIIKRFLFCCLVNNLSFNFEFVAELYYCVLCNLHILYFYNLLVYKSCAGAQDNIKRRMKHSQRRG